MKTRYYIKGKYIFKDIGVLNDFMFNSISKYQDHLANYKSYPPWLEELLKTPPPDELYLTDKQYDRYIKKGYKVK